MRYTARSKPLQTMKLASCAASRRVPIFPRVPAVPQCGISSTVLRHNKPTTTFAFVLAEYQAHHATGQAISNNFLFRYKAMAEANLASGQSKSVLFSVKDAIHRPQRVTPQRTHTACSHATMSAKARSSPGWQQHDDSVIVIRQLYVAAHISVNAKP